MRALSVVLLWMAVGLGAWGQSGIQVAGAPTLRLQRRIEQELRKLDPRTPDSLIRTKATELAGYLQQEGYPEAAVQELRRTEDSLVVRYNAGRRYLLDTLTIQNCPERWLLEAGDPPVGRSLSWQAIDRYLQEVLRLHADNGYPFAQLPPPSIRYRQQDSATIRVTATYVLQQGPLVTVDTVGVQGQVREPTRLVQQLIGIRPGDLYRQRQVDAAPQVLNSSIYFRDVKPAQVGFRYRPSEGNMGVGAAAFDSASAGARIVIPLSQRRSNRFDAILGLLPPRGGNAEWQFTALVDLQLVSALRMGEWLALKYEELPSSSRRIDLRYQQPSILGLPLRAEMRFELQKQDTVFQSVSFEPAAYWDFSPRLALKAYFRSRESSLQAGRAYRTQKWPPPPAMDGSSNATGLGLIYQTLDYRLNPTRGVYVELEAAIGTKTVRRNPQLDSLEFDRIVTSQPRRELRFEGFWYYSLRPRQILVLGNRTWWLDMQQRFLNDLPFIGGSKVMRGFNENQFQASFYTITTVEYRLLLERNSYLAAFLDYGYLEHRTVLEQYVLHPVGVGLGLTLETGAGIISVSYAIGQSEQTPFQPARGRVHIGYVGLF